ncbi:MAG: 8-amino-7-oxononanoate synthase [Desulfatitalea sp.]|nr:8-amino-7-oxononanoate synthase [Desulfatitalea sp.]NNK01175.1 8-amino-7-oxononanoate synthase [Desulfatitalea sp.]
MSTKFNFLTHELEQRQRQQRLRTLQRTDPCGRAVISVAGHAMVNFCANDYLGLAHHPLIAERAVAHIQKYGTGAGASRLICGNLGYFEPVETELARLKGTESALIFNSGFQANVTILPTLADRQSLIFSDRLNHNSLIQGARLARCRVEIFNHNDMDHLAHLLERYSKRDYSRRLIVTESIFSMDGDQAPLDNLVRLAQTHDAILVVDEAHATGVAGPRGMGLACGRGVDVIIGTFSKACGAFGAYVAGSRKLCDYLVNCCPGLIYSTALPPAAVGAIAGALELIPNMEAERRQLRAHADHLRTALQTRGWDCGQSTTQIVPVIVGEASDSLILAKRLAANQIFAQAIRPPTVEEHRARIRLAVSALHERSDVDRVIDTLGYKTSTADHETP